MGERTFMKIGYARVSTEDQQLESQIELLEKAAEQGYDKAIEALNKLNKT